MTSRCSHRGSIESVLQPYALTMQHSIPGLSMRTPMTHACAFSNVLQVTLIRGGIAGQQQLHGSVDVVTGFGGRCPLADECGAIG